MGCFHVGYKPIEFGFTNLTRAKEIEKHIFVRYSAAVIQLCQNIFAEETEL